MPRGGARKGAGRKRTRPDAEPRQKPAIRRESGQFVPGQSGNPAGRPKDDAEIKRLAKSHTTAAIKRLAEWMKSDNAKASVSASVALLDRGWGRPSQMLAVDPKANSLTLVVTPVDEHL